MGLYRSVRAVAGASGDGPVDWTAVADAAKSSTDPGPLDLSADDQAAYATDVRDARDRVSDVAGADVALPETVEVLNRHHWIDNNVDTFRRVMQPVAERTQVVPDVARVGNTGSLAVVLAYLARNVLGQYDPLLLADGDRDHALYFVHPNVGRAADAMAVDRDRFRRWVAFHEVTHAAEFAVAPWLSDHLERGLIEAVDAMAEGHFDRDSLGELDVIMTAVEGYAELLMDRAFDDEYADLRAKLDARRRQGGPVKSFVRRLLGLEMKRRQYERGRAFFETVADERGVAGATRVWEDPESLPTDAELDDPRLWLKRVPE